jgi:hypothetical protein
MPATSRVSAATGRSRMETVLRLAAAVGGPLAERPSDRTITAQTVKHAGVKPFPRGHIQIAVDGFVRDPHPRHRNAPAAATGRSAVATNRHQVWRRPSPPTPHWRPACLLSDAAPSRTQQHRQPTPGTRRGHHCRRSPFTPSTTGRSDQRSIAPPGLPRSHATFLHARPRSHDWPCAAAEPEGSHPTDAGTAGSEAAFRPACAPFPGSNHHGATSPTTDSAARR